MDGRSLQTTLREIPPPRHKEQLVFLNGTISWSCGHTQIRVLKENKSFRGFHAYDPNTKHSGRKSTLLLQMDPLQRVTSSK
ncbi:hypothetical protein CEXT_779111 [Caerostris extrusa]|uniref:Uncharacterized protein n=1 Tax=Caerostris extrusa TaxID=172846 RepID=A0AAV4SMT2_CAEEX|nr:hypothetical protein CEXT_779111 [Caerostris extrusa]